jgi:outer membrane biosynthesis protein TonB
VAVEAAQAEDDPAAEPTEPADLEAESPEPEEQLEAAPPPASTPKPKSKTSRRSKASPSTSPTKASSNTAPRAKTARAAEPDADALLASAKAALSAGRASEAHQLASRSNRKKRSVSALQIMARAGCRMRSEAKAKSAFDRLAITQRGGIRAECRKYGVKLGI